MMPHYHAIQEIQALVAPEMAALSAQVHALVQSKDPLLQQVTQYVLQAPGKQVRPMLVFLVAGACGGITPKAQRGAVLVTLLHQASLVHDDVVDEATHRRGQPAIHAAWNNKVAVLFGDYLLAKSLRLATQYQDHDLLALLTETAQAMSKGELLQLGQAHHFATTEAAYLEIIRQKTAHLFGTCLAIGAVAAGAAAAQVATLRQAGEHMGMAFQLQDDCLDYGTKDIGKPWGMDLQAGHLTLPLIYALQQASAQERQELLHTLKHPKPLLQKQQAVLAFVKRFQGMAYAQATMGKYQQAALEGLQNLQDSAYKKALYLLVQYAMTSNH